MPHCERGAEVARGAGAGQEGRGVVEAPGRDTGCPPHSSPQLAG